MRISEQGLTLIRMFEGFRAEIYLDAAGLPTIGYGHLVRAFERFDVPLTEASATALLRSDVGVAEAAVQRFIAVDLCQHQFDALVSFTFNLGGAVLQRSTLRRVLNRGDYGAVSGQMRRYVFAGGRRLPGLIRRRQMEAALFDG